MEVSTKSPIFADRVDKRIVASTKSAHFVDNQERLNKLERLNDQKTEQARKTGEGIKK